MLAGGFSDITRTAIVMEISGLKTTVNDVELVTERELAATYDGGAYVDAWDAVDQYRRATSYAFRKQVKSGATATALDLPRERIRTWVDDGGAPDAVRALETAREYGWLELGYEDQKFESLNVLVANVFSGGSITTETYAPAFALDGRDSTVLEALETADVEYTIVDDRDKRADEARPTDAASVLGRVLAVLGAPVGEKADQHVSLPTYLEGAPDEIRTGFVDAYLANRAIAHDGKATLHIQERRNRDYLVELARLINDVVGGGVALRERYIVVSADAARRLETRE